MLDLDNFKAVNDRFGHALGDVVLTESAKLFRDQCRVIDIVARYGGEEFVLVFPGTDGHAAAAVCERIRTHLAVLDWEKLHAGLAVAVSAGIAQWHPGMDANTLLSEADEQLYKAKSAGRNQVVF